VNVTEFLEGKSRGVNMDIIYLLVIFFLVSFIILLFYVRRWFKKAVYMPENYEEP
jgi:hypothetical protein